MTLVSQDVCCSSLPHHSVPISNAARYKNIYKYVAISLPLLEVLFYESGVTK